MFETIREGSIASSEFIPQHLNLFLSHHARALAVRVGPCAQNAAQVEQAFFDDVLAGAGFARGSSQPLVVIVEPKQDSV
jgi:hypothetical protein